MSGAIEAQLEKEGFYVSTTVGTSMWPMLRNRRDRVILRPLREGERLSRLDLPLYLRPDGLYVLHRVIGVRDGHYIIRGDNTYAKEIVPDEWIVGVMTEFYRGNRHVSASSCRYRFYAWLWQGIYPIRACVRRVRGLLGRIKRKICKK